MTVRSSLTALALACRMRRGDPKKEKTAHVLGFGLFWTGILTPLSESRIRRGMSYDVDNRLSFDVNNRRVRTRADGVHSGTLTP